MEDSPGSMTQTIVIRHGTPREFEAISKFFGQARHANNAKRDDDLLRETVSNRDLFIVEHRSDSVVRIAGLSSVFYYVAHTFAEAGGSRVTSLVGGFGVHEILHHIRATHVFLMHESGLPVYFAVVKKSNARSIENLEKAGFVVWEEPDQALIVERAGTLSGPQTDASQKLYYRLPPKDAFKAHACALLSKAVSGGWDPNQLDPIAPPSIELTRRNEKTGARESIDLVLNVESLTVYRSVLVGLCSKS